VKKSKKASPFGGLKKQPKKDDNDEDEDEGEGDAKAGTDKIDKKSKNIVGEFELEGSDEDDGFDAEKEAKRLRKLERKIERDKKEFQNLKTLVEKSHRVKLDRKAAQHETNIKKLDSIIKDNRKVITETGETGRGAKRRPSNAISSDENRASSYFRTRHAPSVTNAIILTHHPNPFRDSLRSSQ